MSLTAEFDLKALARELDDVQRNQLPYALARALNRTADEAQQAVRASLGGKFTLRRRTFIERTVKIENKDRATKTKPSVRIGIDPKRDVLAKFEADTTKTPERGKYVAVPIAAQPVKTRVIPAKQRPGALNLRPARGSRGGKRLLVGDRGVFVVNGMILQRTRPRGGKGRRARAVASPRGAVKLLYLLRRQVRIRPVLGFERTVRAVVAQRFDANFAEAMAHALATAR